MNQDEIKKAARRDTTANVKIARTHPDNTPCCRQDI